MIEIAEHEYDYDLDLPLTTDPENEFGEERREGFRRSTKEFTGALTTVVALLVFLSTAWIIDKYALAHEGIVINSTAFVWLFVNPFKLKVTFDAMTFIFPLLFLYALYCHPRKAQWPLLLMMAGFCTLGILPFV